MGAGLPDFVVFNVGMSQRLPEGQEVSLKTLKQARLLNPSGREARLPLKVWPCSCGRKGEPGEGGSEHLGPGDALSAAGVVVEA